jgi:hypothetical protein
MSESRLSRRPRIDEGSLISFGVAVVLFIFLFIDNNTVGRYLLAEIIVTYSMASLIGLFISHRLKVRIVIAISIVGILAGFYAVSINEKDRDQLFWEAMHSFVGPPAPLPLKNPHGD